MSFIQRLGYVGLEVSDLGAWHRFASDFVGLDWSDADPGGIHHLRLDERVSRLQLVEGAADDVAWLGWEVGGPEDLARLADLLDQSGVAVARGSEEEAASRHVLGLVRFRDPAGTVCEAFHGAAHELRQPPRFGRAIEGFVTGDGGAGHVILNVPELEAARAFYTERLGFRLSDRILFSPFPGFTADLWFLHLNSRHHSLALASFPFPRRMQHLMLQYVALDDVGRAWDIAHRDALPVTLTLGRHSNDRMLSFYTRTPSGFDIELGWGAAEIGTTGWSTGLHRHQSIWGHHPGPGLGPPPAPAGPAAGRHP